MHQLQSAQVINNMISVERIQNFCDLPSEAAFTNEYDNQVSPDWPQSGSIDIQDLSVRYRDGLPLSLRNLSFKIDGGSRVGKLIFLNYHLSFISQTYAHISFLHMPFSLIVKESSVELGVAKALCCSL